MRAHKKPLVFPKTRPAIKPLFLAGYVRGGRLTSHETTRHQMLRAFAIARQILGMQTIPPGWHDILKGIGGIPLSCTMGWFYRPPSTSQDPWLLHFSRESLQTCKCHWNPGWGGRSKVILPTNLPEKSTIHVGRYTIIHGHHGSFLLEEKSQASPEQESWLDRNGFTSLGLKKIEVKRWLILCKGWFF